MSVRRRRLTAALVTAVLTPRARAAAAPARTTEGATAPHFAPVVPGYRLRFPHDEGSHPDFRLEWWYVTGWLNAASTEPLGFQITFFRARPQLRHDNPSAFTPRHIVIAHAALSDPKHGRLLSAERAARAGLGLAGSEQGRTRVWVDDWSLEQRDDGYHAAVRWREARFEFALRARQLPLLQGEHGYSRKGPAPLSASYYYSLPHLEVGGTLHRKGSAARVAGVAWLDHEWSSQYMDERAVGWDWIGINLHDGAALMLFRMRGRDDGSFWAGGTLRGADGTERAFGPSEVVFKPGRMWQSPRTGTRYPVSWRVAAGDQELGIEPLMDDQEHDTRASSGTIYWEGAVRALRGTTVVGQGYVELTGYWRRIDLARANAPPSAGSPLA